MPLRLCQLSVKLLLKADCIAGTTEEATTRVWQMR